MSELVRTRVSVITFFIRYVQSHNIRKQSNLKVFGRKKTNCPKHDSQSQIKSSIPAGRNSLVLLITTCKVSMIKQDVLSILINGGKK